MNHPVRSAAFLATLLTAIVVLYPSHGAAAGRVLVRTPPPPLSLDRGPVRAPRLLATAVPDTTWLAEWNFDTAPSVCNLDGWKSTDNTSQPVYTHVDDFAGLGGGIDARLIPIEGAHSLWCGLRPDPNDYTLCQYATLPGYGNGWYQTFGTTGCASVTGDVTVDFLMTWDTDSCCDGTVVQYALCDDVWNTVDIPGQYLNRIDGRGRRQLISATVPAASHSGSLQMRLLFTSDGSYSDQDGLWNTDGAYVLDSLTVRDAGGVVLPTELFEAEAVGAQATVSGNWAAGTITPYGDFAALFSGGDVLQDDPCTSDLSCLWAFFSGSTADYSCGGHPEQAAVPYVNSRGQYIDNEIWSPVVPISGTGSQFEVGFDAYGVPQDPLVAWTWNVRSFVDGCPTAWVGSNFLYFGEADRWGHYSFQFGDLVAPGATDLQVSIRIIDVCQFYCGVAGTGQCHTQGPLIDNVWVRRIDSNGPVWSMNPRTGLFQDNFATDGTTTGTVRTDAAVDLVGPNGFSVLPGDSISVTVYDAEDGLAPDPHTGFGSAAYFYVDVRSPQRSGKTGTAITQNAARWPVVDSLLYGGNTWYCVRMDTAFADPERTNPVGDRFCVDLNDDLFTPGDTLRYVFAAQSAVGATTYYSRFTGTTDDVAYALDNPMEMTCLPSTGPAPGGRILYVDNADGLGVQPFFDTAFDILGIASRVDRYDILAPESGLENGLSSHLVNPFTQLVAPYTAIIWSSGARTSGTLQDAASGELAKYDDVSLLKTFLDNLETSGGIYFNGDDLATDWFALPSAGAVDLRSLYMIFGVLDSDHTDYGLGVSPLVIGAEGGTFSHSTGPDTMIVFGGCPDIERFDVLQPTGDSTTVDAFYNGTAGAVLAQRTTNPLGVGVGVILSGFSFHAIRDARAMGIPARVDHLSDVLDSLGVLTVTPPTAAAPDYGSSLSQNVPNPFNPTTAIDFTVKERSPVTLRVYNVRGQLVRTLVDDTRAPGIVHRITWDGRNDAGQAVASGVYFYRLVTRGFAQTKKMVLLK